MSIPILMGPKGTLLDWRPFEERCIRVLGAVPRNRQFTKSELLALGFDLAAKQAWQWSI